jgi:hypothetical protein
VVSASATTRRSVGFVGGPCLVQGDPGRDPPREQSSDAQRGRLFPVPKAIAANTNGSLLAVRAQRFSPKLIRELQLNEKSWISDDFLNSFSTLHMMITSAAMALESSNEKSARTLINKLHTRASQMETYSAYVDRILVTRANERAPQTNPPYRTGDFITDANRERVQKLDDLTLRFRALAEETRCARSAPLDRYAALIEEGYALLVGEEKAQGKMTSLRAVLDDRDVSQAIARLAA